MTPKDRRDVDAGAKAARDAGDVESLPPGRLDEATRAMDLPDHQPVDLEQRVDRRVRSNAHQHAPTVPVELDGPVDAWQTSAVAKVTIIGAGSVEFTRSILADLCAYEDLHGSLEIALHDIDPERLGYAERAAEQLVERSNAGYRVSAHASRSPAFDGADYLINEIQVGGYQATRTDFDVPKKYGLRQTIGDTIGIGGIMRGLRTIPVMIEMADEMVERCPGGVLLNYTNPMAMVPWGIWAGSRLPSSNVIGVCHSVRDTHSFLARTVGIREDRIEFRTAGFNHQCFVYVFRDRESGEDLYPRLREIVEADREGLGRRVRVELFERFGYFPTESSEHSAEYVPWFLSHDDQITRYRIEVDEYLRRSEENLVEWEGVKGALDAGRELDVDRNDELASQIVRAIETGLEAEVSGNVRNDGLIEGLPEDACVEVPVLVDGTGVHPTRFGALPPQCLALNRTFLNVVELTVRAVVEGSRELAYQAALIDPNTAATLTVDQIVDMVDDLIDAHGELIPEPIRRA
jgi:alpha-galactosidase